MPKPHPALQGPPRRHQVAIKVPALLLFRNGDRLQAGCAAQKWRDLLFPASGERGGLAAAMTPVTVAFGGRAVGGRGSFSARQPVPGLNPAMAAADFCGCFWRRVMQYLHCRPVMGWPDIRSSSWSSKIGH